MKILVTGATGFIGGAAARRLVAEGHEVRCLVRSMEKAAGLAEAGCESSPGDITDADSCREAARGVEAVFHCAALASDFGPWETFRRINVAGSLNVAEAALANKVQRFVYLSTNDVFGVVKNKVIGDSFPHKPTGFQYPDTKAEAERRLFELCRKRGLPLVAFRPAWVYGPGDRTFLPEIVHALAKGEMIYPGNRNNALHLNYIDNLLDALMLGLQKKEAVGRGYLVTDGPPITWEQIITTLSAGLGLRPPRFALPAVIGYAVALGMEAGWKIAGAKSRPLLTRYAVTFMTANMRYSDKRLREELGYEPKILPQEGLARSVSWLRDQDLGAIKVK